MRGFTAQCFSNLVMIYKKNNNVAIIGGGDGGVEEHVWKIIQIILIGLNLIQK